MFIWDLVSILLGWIIFVALILFVIIKLFEVISTVISTLKVGIEYRKKLKQLKNK
jgi:hypothetical protein|nr:MAG TPA: hypothetical protein [Caudoviricetes sp.]DAO13894.1 MAG TPA: hypothetical protein [Caudoviricetes sp.]DAR31769.1 MAG TPA: hypothetical protein [Caudoviricetes sp.]DAR41647.1 MAG TPA: hypothetical protein [Caudoviricetes sp.]